MFLQLVRAFLFYIKSYIFGPRKLPIFAQALSTLALGNDGALEVKLRSYARKDCPEHSFGENWKYCYIFFSIWGSEATIWRPFKTCVVFVRKTNIFGGQSMSGFCTTKLRKAGPVFLSFGFTSLNQQSPSSSCKHTSAHSRRLSQQRNAWHTCRNEARLP